MVWAGAARLDSASTASLAESDSPDPDPEPNDLRMPALGAAAWGSGVLVAAAPAGTAVALLAAAAGALLLLARRRATSRRHRLTVLALLLVAAAVLGGAALRTQAVSTSPVAELARDRAAVEVTGTVVSDPKPVRSRFGEQIVVRLQVREVVGRGWRHRLRAPLLLFAGDDWRGASLGATVRATGRLAPADDPGLAGMLNDVSAPERVEAPSPWWQGAAAVRAAVRQSVAHRPDEQRALVPALVDGDDAGLAPDLEEDFRVTGLTHLTAVSGTNLTLVVGFLLIAARWCRVRGRWLTLVAAVGIVGFVLLARTEPSVLRAAAMGSVGLLALGVNGRNRALRGLGVAVVVLLLVEPSLAVSAGFALSVLATAGIVLLAPPWRDVLARWLPRWLAEAISVPAAAQLACTPVVAAISGQVSLVAVLANLLVSPAVGPATVLGLGGGLVTLVWAPAGRLLGTGASWCVGWVVTVARTGADLPQAALQWGTGAASLAVLTLLCVAVALLAPVVLRRPRVAVPLAALVCLVVAVGWPVRDWLGGWPGAGWVGAGWPGEEWVLAMCDVGQGDALVLRAAPGTGVVVDTGPDPEAVDACLDRLDVDRVPLVVLTHFHADHVGGLPGVVEDRDVGEVWTTPLLDPVEAVAEVRSQARAAGVTPTLPARQARTYGAVTLQAVWPPPRPPRRGPGDGSTANDASVVLVAEVGGVRVLLTGDLEPPGQTALSQRLPALQVDVLKVPHHGSSDQDLDWLTSLGADVALVPVGAGNDYGHPDPYLLEALQRTGLEVARTDRDGDVLVLPEDEGGGVRLRTRD